MTEQCLHFPFWPRWIVSGAPEKCNVNVSFCLTKHLVCTTLSILLPIQGHGCNLVELIFFCTE